VNFHPDSQARTHRTRTAAVLALVAGALALAGCGSSSSTTSSSSSPAPAATPTTSSAATAASGALGGAAQTVALAANPEGQLKYDKTSATVKAGRVNIVFTNMAPLEHNVTVESSSHAAEGATPTFKGGSKTLSLTLKPGTYKFFCSVPGHRAAGMEGTLTVQ
jgi:plastocyanin